MPAKPIKLREFTFIERAIIPVALEAVKKLMKLKLGSEGSYIPYRGYVAPETVKFLLKRDFTPYIRNRILLPLFAVLKASKIRYSKVKAKEFSRIFVYMLYRRIPIPASGVLMTHKPELNDGIETILLDQITPVAVLGKLVRNIRDNIPLSSDVIDAYYAGIPLYRGVIYINDLEKIPPLADKEFMIVAIDLNPDDNIIAHFVALRRDGDKAQYFNSYGTFVPAQIRAFVERSGIRSILSSERFIQPADGSALCGYYCLYVIDGWRQDKPYAEVIAPFRIADKGNKHDIRVLIDHFNRVPDDLAEELQKINV